MSACSHRGMSVPIFTSGVGFYPSQCCGTQYRNMRYLTVGFPQCVRIVRVLAMKGVWYCNPFNSPPDYEDICHILR